MRSAELDGIRGIAILGVLAAHSYGGILGGGWLAIDVFFVLSGYLITKALLRDGSLLRFYGRRVSRIWPPLVAAVALAYVIAPGFDVEPAAYFYANFVPSKSLGSLAHLWYLSIEEQFYVVWPLAFLFLPRGVVVATVIGAGWLFHIWMAGSVADLDIIHRSTFSRMDALAIGCALALVRPQVGRSVGLAAFAATVVALFAATPTPLTVALGLALYPIVCAGVIAARTHIAPLRFPPLVYFGERALGIYLYHYPVFCFLAPLQRPHHRVEWMIIAVAKIALSIAIAELSYRTLERWSVAQLFPWRAISAMHATSKDGGR